MTSEPFRAILGRVFNLLAKGISCDCFAVATVLNDVNNVDERDFPQFADLLKRTLTNFDYPIALKEHFTDFHFAKKFWEKQMIYLTFDSSLSFAEIKLYPRW